MWRDGRARQGRGKGVNAWRRDMASEDALDLLEFLDIKEQSSGFADSDRWEIYSLFLESKCKIARIFIRFGEVTHNRKKRIL